jgi:hypothetical protein
MVRPSIQQESNMNVPKLPILAATVLTLTAYAPARAQTVCSPATISGQYAVHGQGWVGTGTVDPSSPEVVVGLRAFDGKGTFSGSGHQAIAGLSRPFTIKGTYEVAADCSITIQGIASSSDAPTRSEGISMYGVITDAGNRIYATRTNDGATTSTEFDRIAPAN